MTGTGLDFCVVPVEFSKGLDTRTNPKLVLPGRWTSLVNCTAADDGTLTKRAGHQRVSWNLGATNGHGLAEFDDQLLVVNGPTVRSLTAPGNSWIPTDSVQVPGVLPYLHVRRRSVARATERASSPDFAVGAGLEAYVWLTHDPFSIVTGISMVVIDSVTGVLMTAPQVVVSSPTARSPRVVWDGGAFVILFVDAGIMSARCVWPGPGQMLGAPAVLATAPMHGSVIDACRFGYGTTAVSYRSTDATYSVYTSRITRAGLVAAVAANVPLMTQAQIPAVNIVGVGVGKMGPNYCGTFTYAPLSGLGYALEGVAGCNVNAAWLPCAATQVTPPAAGNFLFCHVATTDSDLPGLDSACVCVDAEGDINGVLGVAGLKALWRGYIQPGAPAAPQVVQAGSGAFSISCTYLPAMPPATAPPQGPFIAGKPVITGPPNAAGTQLLGRGIVTLPTRMIPVGAAIQSGMFFLDVYDCTVVGKALYGRMDRYRGGDTTTPSTHYVGPWLGATEPARPDLNTFVVPALEIGRLEFTDGANTTQSGVSRLAVTPNSPYGTSEAGAFAPSSVQLGRGLHVANGMLGLFDGERIVESAWNLYPETVSATAAGGGTWPVGVYQLTSVYEWVDGQGQRHQSAPGTPFQLTIGAPNSVVTVSTPTLQLTQRAGVLHVVYSTLANGTVFYRCSDIIPNNAASALTTTAIVSPPSAANELLYSQPFQAGTTLANISNGPCSTVTVHQGRLWVDLTDQEDALRYSQQWVEGQGLQWAEELERSLPTEAGGVTRLVSMDDMLTVLTATRLYRIVGSGPSPSGANNGYSDATEIPSDVGASNGRAVVLMPDGVVFLSRKGWYRLSRDLSVRYVGEAVKGFDADSFTSAVVVPDRQELRIGSSASLLPGYFTPGSPGLKGAVQLCYSYVSDVWSMFTVQCPTIAGQDWLRTHDARWWSAAGRYVTVSLWDGINWDTPGTYVDQPGAMLAGLSVGMSGRTGFLALSGLNGFQRVRWLYLTMSAPLSPAASFTLTVDYDDAYQALLPPGQPGAYVTTVANLATVPWTSLAAIDVRHKLRRQKCKSVAFTVAEMPLTGGPGVTGMQAMSLAVGLRRGANRLPGAQGVG